MNRSLITLFLVIVLFGCIEQDTSITKNNTHQPVLNHTIATQNLTNITNSTKNTSNMMPRYIMEIYDPTKTYNGITLFIEGQEKVVEIDMNGNITWECSLPDEFKNQDAIAFDVELLDNGNVLLVISKSGVYEMAKNCSIIWSYLDPKVSHDADILDNGNILVNFGHNDQVNDTQIKEVNQNGERMWSWQAKDYYLSSYPPSEWIFQGWVHSNAVERFSNGNTMISLRNFGLTVVVDENGDIVREYDWKKYGTKPDPHEPEFDEDNNTLLVCLQNDAPYAAIEIDAETEEILWFYPSNGLRTTRDCDKLPNGNYLLTTVDNGGTNNYFEDDYSVLLEITPEKEIVWKFKLNIPVGHEPGNLFKAQRI